MYTLTINLKSKILIRTHLRHFITPSNLGLTMSVIATATQPQLTNGDFVREVLSDARGYLEGAQDRHAITC